MYVCITVDAGVLRRVLVVLGCVTNKMSQDQLIKLQGCNVYSLCVCVCVCAHARVYVCKFV